jgi:hypothetical protein
MERAGGTLLAVRVPARRRLGRRSAMRDPHMAGFFRKLFGKSPASQSALPTADRNAFFRQLGEQDIFVIAAMQGDGIDPHGMTTEQLLAEIERAAKDLSEDKAREPFVYEKEGQRRLPFFTSNDCAQTFVGGYSKERDRVYPFQLLGVKGPLLAQILLACDVLVMNDRSADEVELSDDDAAAIRRMWG